MNDWRQGFYWSDGAVTRIKELYTAGMSCSEIAAAMGGEISRNAVIGKLHRLGLVGMARARKIAARAAAGGELPYVPRRKGGLKNTPGVTIPRATAEKREPRSVRENKAMHRAAMLAATEIVDLSPEESETAVPLSRLNGHTCRWPLGDPRDLAALRFCGAEPADAYPYCAKHCGMAYVRPEARPGRSALDRRQFHAKL